MLAARQRLRGVACETIGTERVLTVLDPSPVRAQGRGAARLGGQGGARRGRKGRRRKTQKRIRSDVESCAGTGGAGRAAGLLADDIVTRRPPALDLLFHLVLALLVLLVLLVLLILLVPLALLVLLVLLVLVLFRSLPLAVVQKASEGHGYRMEARTNSARFFRGWSRRVRETERWNLM